MTNIAGNVPEKEPKEHSVISTLDGYELKMTRVTPKCTPIKGHQGVITNVNPLCYKPINCGYTGDHIDCNGLLPVGDTPTLNDIVVILEIFNWKYAIRTGEVML